MFFVPQLIFITFYKSNFLKGLLFKKLDHRHLTCRLFDMYCIISYFSRNAAYNGHSKIKLISFSTWSLGLHVNMFFDQVVRKVYDAIAYRLVTIPAVRLTCIACFSPISQSILNRFSLMKRTIFESRSDYREIFIWEYCIAKKLDHLACDVIQG